MSKVIILGSGAASGVPTISKGWGNCRPDNPKNRRSRAGIYLEIGKFRYLIDTSADLRCQLLENGIKSVDAVFYTHTHADHLMGIDDLRAIANENAAGLNIYASQRDIEEIRHRFGYVLADVQLSEITHRPKLIPNVAEYLKPMQINNIEVVPLEFAGHPITTTGYAFNKGELVIIPDYRIIPPQTLAYLQKIDVNVLIMPLTVIEEGEYHAGMDTNKHYIDIIKPQKVIFTHLGPECDYDEARKVCPDNADPAYDNMTIEL